MADDIVANTNSSIEQVVEQGRRVALITGAGGGIGRGLALAFSGAGMRVVVNDIDRDAAEACALAVRDEGGEAIVDFSDITRSDQVRKLVGEAVREFGRVDVLVNNAGQIRDGLVHEMSDEKWDAVLNLCLRGAFLCSREVLPGMLERRWGRIVNIASMSYRGNVGQANYASAKAGLVGLTQSVGLEVAAKGITVNCIAPGLIRTPATEALPESVRDRLIRVIPAKALGTPGDIAAAALFFASEGARYITRQVLHVSGGHEGF